MSESFAEIAGVCPDKWVDYIRELRTYDVLCPTCCEFKRNEHGLLEFARIPSPLHWSRQYEYPWILHHGDFHLEFRVLDIGSSWSVLQYALASRCAELVTLDSDQVGLYKALATIKKLGFGNIKQVCGDARKLPFESGTFDRVVCCSVLEHIETNHSECVSEILRVLKPNGIALITLDVVSRIRPNFYLDVGKVESILLQLGVCQISISEVAYAKLEEDIIHVLMIKYTKPSKEIQL